MSDAKSPAEQFLLIALEHTQMNPTDLAHAKLWLKDLEARGLHATANRVRRAIAAQEIRDAQTTLPQPLCSTGEEK